MNLHRILSGSPEVRGELVAAGIFVAVWFVMDLAQWVDWVESKINPPQQAFCLPIGTPVLTDIPKTTNTPLLSPAAK